MVVLTATLAFLLATVDAQQNQNQNQNQNSNPPQNQQGQQNQQTQQNQQAQPQPKKGFWQKVRDMSQTGQNVIQQGSNTVQQGRGTIQQTGQQVQGTIQQTGQPVQGGVQQFPNGMQQGTDGTQGAVNDFQAGGGGAGACGPSCFDAGAFQANVSQMTMSQQGGWHVIRMNIQFHNATNAPLILAYHDGSMVMVDGNGNTYIPAGGNPGELQGMGIDRGNQTDSQFQLGPGQTGYALFSVARSRAANSAVGTSYSYNLTIDELQLQNDALAIPVRMYNLNFPSLTAGTSAASFGGTAPATGYVSNGRNNTGVAVPQGSAQNLPGKAGAIGAAVPQAGVAGQRQVGSVGAVTPQGAARGVAVQRQVGAAVAVPQGSVQGQQVGTAVPQNAVQNVPVQRQAGAAGASVGVSAQQRGIANGGKAAAIASQPMPASPVNNAAMKTAMPTAMRAPASAPPRTQAAPVVAAKPNAATPAVKPTPAASQKKVPVTTTTTPQK